MIVHTAEGQYTIADDSQVAQAYRALSVAADRMGRNNHAEQCRAWEQQKRSARTFRFTVTAEHRAIVEAMPRVLAGEITPETAMGMLWEHDTMAQRLGTNDPYAHR